jgi:acyl carrier protein
VTTEDQIRDILMDLLDVDPEDILADTYVIRDLGAESIDLLELAVALNDTFQVEIVDDEIFLHQLREFIAGADDSGLDREAVLSEKFTSLTRERIAEILGDLPGGPVLKVKDLVSYVQKAGADAAVSA